MAKGHRANGLRIAKARLALPDRPTQAEFARRIGIHWVTQSNIENGKVKVSLELIEKIAAETGTTRDHLLGLDEDQEAASMAPLAAEQFFNTEALDAFLRGRAELAISRASHPQGERATERTVQ